MGKVYDKYLEIDNLPIGSGSLVAKESRNSKLFSGSHGISGPGERIEERLPFISSHAPVNPPEQLPMLPSHNAGADPILPPAQAPTPASWTPTVATAVARPQLPGVNRLDIDSKNIAERDKTYGQAMDYLNSLSGMNFQHKRDPMAKGGSEQLPASVRAMTDPRTKLAMRMAYNSDDRIARGTAGDVAAMKYEDQVTDRANAESGGQNAAAYAQGAAASMTNAQTEAQRAVQDEKEFNLVTAQMQQNKQVNGQAIVGQQPAKPSAADIARAWQERRLAGK